MSGQHKNWKRSIEIRSLVVVILFFLFFLVLIANLARIQIVKADKLSQKAGHLSLKKVTIPAKRGEIVDKDGQKLAITIETKKLIADPILVKEKRRTSSVLSGLIDVKKDKLLEKLQKNTRYVVLKESISLEKSERIKEESLPGIFFEPNYSRVYPNDSLACHVIGFVNKQINKDTGQYLGKEGLEYVYNNMLSGKPGYVIAQFDRSGKVIPGTEKERVNAYDGLNLVTTIDKEIQYFAEKELSKCMEEHQADWGTVIVMNPKNGEIYAMVSYPRYNPNEFSKVKNKDVFINNCVRTVYEPGSTMKPLTVAACIEEGLVAPDTAIYLPEKLKVGGYTIGESHHRSEGMYTVTEIIAESYNIGAVKLAEKLGENKFYSYMQAFGLGQQTNIDLNGEQSGYLPTPESWSKSTFANLPFGQGLSATPLQVLRAISVFANDGALVNPHLMKYAYDIESGTKTRWDDSKDVKVVSNQTAKIMTDLLEVAVEKGTGNLAQVPGYRVAGKTGTAQIPDIENGGYLNSFVASFVGYAPVSEPRISIIVVISNPKGLHYGGSIAGPVFSKIAEFSLVHLGIPPDKERKNGDLKEE